MTFLIEVLSKRHLGPESPTVRSARKAIGYARIYIPGEIEPETEEENWRLGIFIIPSTMAQIQRLNRELNLGFKF